MTRLGHRQEIFCRRFVEGANATQAAKSAGYAAGSARNAGYRLLQRPQIIARIAELHRELAMQRCRDVDVLIGKLEAIYRRAIDAQQCSAAARAVELQARLSSGRWGSPDDRHPRLPKDEALPVRRGKGGTANDNTP